MAKINERYVEVNMKAFTEWLIYLLTGAYVIAMAGAGVGLFLGVAWKAFRLVV